MWFHLANLDISEVFCSLPLAGKAGWNEGCGLLPHRLMFTPELNWENQLSDSGG